MTVVRALEAGHQRRNDPDGDLEVADLKRELEAKGLGDLLTEAQKALLVDLLAKVKAGVANHQEKAVLRNMLRDNGLVMAPQDHEAEERDRQRPPADLPEYGDPDYEA